MRTSTKRKPRDPEDYHRKTPLEQACQARIFVVTSVPATAEIDEYLEWTGPPKERRLRRVGQEGDPETWVRARLPAFVPGELLLVDHRGREITGLKRRPRDWQGIGLKEFPYPHLLKALRAAEMVRVRPFTPQKRKPQYSRWLRRIENSSLIAAVVKYGRPEVIEAAFGSPTSGDWRNRASSSLPPGSSAANT